MRPTRVELPPGLGAALRCATAALARTQGVVIGGVALLALSMGLLGFVVVAHGMTLLALGLLATSLHELGHLLAYRLVTPSGAAVLECDSLHAAFHREPLGRRADRAVTLAGPLAPLLLVIALAPLCGVLPAEAVAAALVAVAHLASLALPSADRRAWRQAAQHTDTPGDASPTLLA
jgi:hypothetical protein